jgi:CheY-like chemotaxis protein
VVFQIPAQEQSPRRAPLDLSGKRGLALLSPNSTSQLLEKWFASFRLDVKITSNPDEFFQRYQTEKLDLAFVDLQTIGPLPPRFEEQLSILHQSAKSPFILISAFRMRNEITARFSPDAVRLVYKPLRPAPFEEALLQALKMPAHFPKTVRTLPQSFDKALATKHPLKILLADDNVINQKVGAGLLRKLGYAPEVVNNGREVLDALGRQRFDLIFLDVQMPELDGFETARLIHNKYPESARPIMIAMTGAAMEEDRRKCFEAGIDDYLSKPVRLVELENALVRWGQRRKAQTG